MQFRFHVYQQSAVGGNIGRRLSGAALDLQYDELLPALRRYCAARQLELVVMVEATDPELNGRIITLGDADLHEAQAEALMGEFLHYLNKLVRGLHLMAGRLE